jgi:CHAT domain-containing protein
MRRILTSLLCLLSLALPTWLRAQTYNNDTKAIEQLIASNKWSEAEHLFNMRVQTYLQRQSLDTLIIYIPLKGKIAQALYGTKKASSIVFSFIDLLKSKAASPTQLVSAFTAAAGFFDSVKQYSDCYKAWEGRLVVASKLAGKRDDEVARSHFYLGEYAFKMGDVGLYNMHQRLAYSIRTAARGISLADLYLSTNAMGRVMGYSSRNDSALLYYQKAISILQRLPQDDINRYYRPAIIHRNQAIIQSAIGQNSEAIKSSYKAIDLFKRYVSTPQSPSAIQSAKEDLYRAVDNLSNYYLGTYDMDRARDLLLYSYGEKKRNFKSNYPGLFMSEILLGHIYTSRGEYEQAKLHLQAGLARMKNAEGSYTFWAADAWSDMGIGNYETKNIPLARICFERADSLYEVSYQGVYDDVYIVFSRDISLFYAKSGDYDKAISKAKKVYQYLVSIHEERSLLGSTQLTHIAEMYYMAKRYKEAIKYSNIALHQGGKKINANQSALDSINVEAYKSQALLIRAKALYAQHPVRDSGFLKRLYFSLDSALQILERQKLIVGDPERVNILIKSNKELIDFAAKIALELYSKASGSLYLEKFLNLKESGLYGRIRSRLEQAQAIRFADVSPAVLDEEVRLKGAMRNSLSEDKAGKDAITEYIKAVNNWEAYLARVKQQYPKYYKLRYAALYKSLAQLQTGLPPKTTLVRYFFVDTSLVALVADNTRHTIISLNAEGLDEKITGFLKHTSGEKEQLRSLHELYKQLWAPLQSYIGSEKVIIIPDGVLYNLGFEMLPVAPIKSYYELRTKSLLAKHTISYHYSIFMLEDPRGQGKYSANYVAFAPGFSDRQKREYADKLDDSLLFDRSYATLLPQPNTGSLAKKIEKLIGGEMYLDDASTRSSFREHAGNHKVIHLATHAEYNNMHPGLSRLVFAKDGNESDSNYLYLRDIFSCDLSSDLTVLTACESGRPGKGDGEGMISLAHAFNYAGSRNILTALWKIDEQSSSHITESFISYLKEGMPTDEALRKAKLDYLQQAEGRLADPGYWSGLVLMGMPEQVQLHTEANYTIVLLLLACMLGATLLIFALRRKLVRA